MTHPLLLSCLVVSSSSATPWTVAHQAPLSVEFSRQEYWSGLPFSSSGDLPNPGIEPRSPALYTNSLPSEPPGKPPASLLFRNNLCCSPNTRWVFITPIVRTHQDRWRKARATGSQVLWEVHASRGCTGALGMCTLAEMGRSQAAKAAKTRTSQPGPGRLTR